MRSLLTMVGIFIGIAAVVALISLSQGLQNAIALQFVKLGSDKLIVQAAGFGYGPPGTSVSNPLTIDDKKAVEKVKGVDTAVGRLVKNTKIEFKKEIKYGYAASVPDGNNNEELDLVIEANDYEIEEGRLLKKGDKYNVMVGSSFTEDYFDHPIELRSKLKISGHDFDVAGILKKSGNPQQDLSIVVPESMLRGVLDLEDEYDVIVLKIEAGEDIAAVEQRVKKELRMSRNVEEGKEDFTVESPGSILQALNTILAVVQGVLVGIASISLIVGGIGIMNTMYTAVLERTREIGIMKALGARRRSILFLFLIESGFLGLVGGVIGVGLGMAVSKLVEIIAFSIYGTYLIQASFNLWIILGALLFAFSLGAASGVFPAKQAAELPPVEALRQ